jgi:hypothetical protein
MKLKRGQKLCNKCNTINGARAYACKSCGEAFSVKAANSNTKVLRKKKYMEINWHELEADDYIKVFGRSGNYYVNDMGEKSYMSHPGIYRIKNKDHQGLVVYSSNGGYGYIYMGPEKQSDLIDNYYRSPHKIVKINRENLRV